MNRTQILREPGLIEFNSAKFHAAQAISIDQVDEFFDVPSADFGKIEDRVSDRRYEIRLTPVGQWDSLSVLFPYFATQIGDDIFGASDVPLHVWCRSGRKYTFHNARITSIPAINAAVGNTLLGEIVFTALLAKDKAPGDSAAYYTLATGTTYPNDSTFSKSAILTKHPSLAWGGSAPWDDFVTVAGVQIDQALTLTPKKATGYGTIGMVLADLQLSAQFQPAGDFDADDLLTACEGNGVLGASPTVNDLVVSYSGFYFSLANAALRMAKFRFGTGEGDNLIQGIEARATRSFTTGVADALGYAGTAAPE